MTKAESIVYLANGWTMLDPGAGTRHDGRPYQINRYCHSASGHTLECDSYYGDSWLVAPDGSRRNVESVYDTDRVFVSLTSTPEPEPEPAGEDAGEPEPEPAAAPTSRLEMLESALVAARETLAIAERRRPRDVAGASVARNAARVERARAKVERLERLIAAERLAGEPEPEPAAAPAPIGVLSLGGAPGRYTLRRGLTGAILAQGDRAAILSALSEVLG